MIITASVRGSPTYLRFLFIYKIRNLFHRNYFIRAPYHGSFERSLTAPRSLPIQTPLIQTPLHQSENRELSSGYATPPSFERLVMGLGQGKVVSRNLHPFKHPILLDSDLSPLSGSTSRESLVSLYLRPRIEHKISQC